MDVFFAGGGGIDVEVVSPAGEFESVVAHFFCERGEFFEGEVGPLAGEEGDGTRHDVGGVFEVKNEGAICSHLGGVGASAFERL